MSFYKPFTYQEASQLFAPISESSSGDRTIVAAVAGKRIRVIRYEVVTAADVVLTWKSSTAGAISGPLALGNSATGAGGGISSPVASCGIMQTVAGEGLVLNLSDAVSVGGDLTYILI